jgi:hypothetical protein
VHGACDLQPSAQLLAQKVIQTYGVYVGKVSVFYFLVASKKQTKNKIYLRVKF